MRSSDLETANRLMKRLRKLREVHESGKSEYGLSHSNDSSREVILTIPLEEGRRIVRNAAMTVIEELKDIGVEVSAEEKGFLG